MGCCCSTVDDEDVPFLEAPEDNVCNYCYRHVDTLHNVVYNRRPMLFCDMCKLIFVEQNFN